MQRSLNGANNFSSLIGNALNKYANLADIGDAPTARTNLGLVGQLTVVSSDYLYQNPGTFDGTTNSQIGVNASTNATASTLVAYDASGTIGAYSYQIIDYQNNAFTSIQFVNLIPLSQNIANTWSISAPSYANVSGNIYHFERKIAGNNNYFGVLNVDYIYLTSAASSLTISAPVNVGAITTSGNIKFNTANSVKKVSSKKKRSYYYLTSIEREMVSRYRYIGIYIKDLIRVCFFSMYLKKADFIASFFAFFINFE
jgi:hypothetical protein